MLFESITGVDGPVYLVLGVSHNITSLESVGEAVALRTCSHVFTWDKIEQMEKMPAPRQYSTCTDAVDVSRVQLGSR